MGNFGDRQNAGAKVFFFAVLRVLRGYFHGLVDSTFESTYNIT